VGDRTGKFLVTGGAGFIGSNLVAALVERGADVRVVDNLSTGRRENLAPFEDRIEFVEGDLSDAGTAARACEGASLVFHLAALAGVPASMERTLDYARHNVAATVNVLVAAKDARARRVVFSSSSSVYGGEGPFPQTEDAPVSPKNPYAASKACCEIYVKTFATAFGADCVSLRYFNVYGPGQPLKSRYSAVFPAFATCILKGEAPVVEGDGLQTRDFTYVSDVVRANLLAAERTGPFKGEVVNVAGGERASVLDIVRAVNQALGTDIRPTHAGVRPGDVRDSLADLRRAKELLGYEPEVGLEDGLKRTVEYFRGIIEKDAAAGEA
jgi:UDP-glucose 4-epimerase